VDSLRVTRSRCPRETLIGTMALPSLASLLVACCVIATAVAAPSLTVNVTGVFVLSAASGAA